MTRYAIRRRHRDGKGGYACYAVAQANSTNGDIEQ